MRLQQSYQQTPGLKNLTSSRHGATTITGSKEDTAPAKPLTKKGKSIVLDNRKSRQIPRSSKPKTVSKPQRKATANRNEQSRNQPSRKGVKRGKAKSSDPALGSSEIVLADESGRSDRREEFESLDDHQVLTQEALKQHTLNSGLVGAAHDEELTCKYCTGFLDLTDIKQMLIRGRNSITSTDICLLWTRRLHTSLQQF